MVKQEPNEEQREERVGENGNGTSLDEDQSDQNVDGRSGSNRPESVTGMKNGQSSSGKPVDPKAGDERYSELLLMLPTLRSLNKQILVELFFSGLIGNVQIENVIPFILKMDVLQIFGKESLVQMSSSIGGGGSNGSSNILGASLRSMVAVSGIGNDDDGSSPLCVETAGMDEDDEDERGSVDDDDDRHSP